MSDNWIILIPEDPRYVPEAKVQHPAIDRLRKIAPNSDEIKTTTSDKIGFFHCGGNFELVACPICNSTLPDDWWQDQMNEEHRNNSQLRPVHLPCCSAERTLHELRYEGPQGFGRFSLEAMNPNIGLLSEADKSKLEEILGCPLRVIYKHI